MKLSVTILLLLVAIPASAAEPAKPNILIILADDMGFSDAGCYGGEIATPNLDALAKNGLALHRSFTTRPAAGRRGRRFSPGTMPSKSAATPFPASRAAARAFGLAWARLLPEMLKPLGLSLVPLGQMARRRQAARKTGSTTRTASTTTTGTSHPASHTEDDKPLPAVDARGRLLLHHGDRRPRHQMPEGTRGETRRTSRFWNTWPSPRPHFPLQAPAEDIARYRKKYLAGWDAMREQRWQRMKELKIGGTALAPPSNATLGRPMRFLKPSRSSGRTS